MLAAGSYQNELHDEIWQFVDGFWQKSESLWRVRSDYIGPAIIQFISLCGCLRVKAIQSADWDDIILEADFKEAVKKDVYGFFDSEDLYKSLAIPWKVAHLFF